jgi:glycerophosphoryl diester phosphodiesterase
MNRFRYAAVPLLALLAAGCAVTGPTSPQSGPMTAVLAHRGVHQQFDRRGLGRHDCTAVRMLPPTHAYLENTIDSMAAAFEAGATRVEFDVHPTADGEFIVFHDWGVDCRTDGHGVTRAQTTTYLKSLDIGHGYTADGGNTYPFRGRFRGAMPTMPQVMATFPGRRFLVNMKSNSADEGRRLARYVASRGWDLENLAFAGADRPIDALRAELPGARVLSPRGLKECVLGYALAGWFGHLPQACRNAILLVPVNMTWMLAGWPDRYLARMEAAHSEVYLVGPFRGSYGLAGIDDPAELPSGRVGGVFTNRVEVIGPALRGAGR